MVYHSPQCSKRYESKPRNPSVHTRDLKGTTSSECLHLCCLIRRALAMEQANIWHIVFMTNGLKTSWHADVSSPQRYGIIVLKWLNKFIPIFVPFCGYPVQVKTRRSSPWVWTERTKTRGLGKHQGIRSLKLGNAPNKSIVDQNSHC